MSSVSAAVFDYQTGTSWTVDGDRWFHAASTIKIAILACVYRTLEEERLDPGHRLLVRNVFPSATGGTPFSVQAARDTDADTHASIGQTLPVSDLARRMIVVSGNLATNVLLDFVGVGRARRILAAARIDESTGVDLVRGVEDDRAFEAGLSNQVTANGLAGLLRAILDGRFASKAHTADMLDILCGQTFRSGIPGGPAARDPRGGPDCAQDRRNLHRDARRRDRVPARPRAVCPGGVDGMFRNHRRALRADRRRVRAGVRGFVSGGRPAWLPPLAGR